MPVSGSPNQGHQGSTTVTHITTAGHPQVNSMQVNTLIAEPACLRAREIKLHLLS